MGATLGVATLQTDVDQKGLSKGLDQSEKKSKQKLKKIGNALTTGFGVAIAQGITRIVGRAITGLFEGIQQTFKDLTRIQRISTQTAAVIESTGAAAGITVKELEDMSGALEDLTSVEAEAVQEAGNMLLTFTKIGEDVFPQALNIVTDMSVALGQDLTQISIQVGKALNDPIAGISALTRVGVTFTDEQKDVIKSLAETGDIAGAQKIILDELGKEFGGSAEAFGGTIEGIQALVVHQVGTIKETLLEEFLPLIREGFSKLNDFLRGEQFQEVLQEAIDWIKKVAIPTIMGIVEAVKFLITGDLSSGLLSAFGLQDISQLIKFRDVIFKVFDFIKQNWPAIKGALAGIAAVFVGSQVVSIITAIGVALGTLFSPLGAVIAIVALLGAAWATDFGGIQTTLTEWWVSVGEPLFKQLVEWLGVAIPAAIAIMSQWWQNIFNWLKINALPVLMSLFAWLGEKIPIAIAAVSTFFQNTLLPAIQAVTDWVAVNLFPLFEALGAFLVEVFNVAWTALSIIFETLIMPGLSLLSDWLTIIFTNLGEDLMPVLEVVSKFLKNVFLASVDGVRKAIRTLVEWIKKAVDWLKQLDDSLPDDLTPGSPTPFELGLRGINAELANLGSRISPITIGFGAMDNIPMPDLAAGRGAGVDQEQLTIIVDTMIGQEAWINALAKKIKPALDTENIRTSAQGAGGLTQ